ncbi:MAG: hypothetical protein RL645_826 [Actinomycetota bacterium]|jgi:hypothetical protein
MNKTTGRIAELARRLRHPWIWMFVITASFQIFRGSQADAIIFWSFTAIAIASQLNLPRRVFTVQPRLTRNRIQLWAILLTALLVGVPRHTGLYGWVMVCLGAVAIALSWQPDSSAKPRGDRRIRRAKIGWMTIGIGLCIWELGANILGQLEGNLTEFPTISVLVDPLLDHPLGKGVFAVAWLLSGFGFMRLWGRGK